MIIPGLFLDYSRIVDAPSGLDGRETAEDECYERGDEAWWYYNYSRKATPPRTGWRCQWGNGEPRYTPPCTGTLPTV